MKHLGVFCHCNTLKVYHPQGSFVYSADFSYYVVCLDLHHRLSDVLSQDDSFFSENIFNFSCNSMPLTLQCSKFSSGFVSLGNSANVPIDIQ